MFGQIRNISRFSLVVLGFATLPLVFADEHETAVDPSIDPSIMTAEYVAAPLERLNRELIPEWRTIFELAMAFHLIRTSKLLPNEDPFAEKALLPWEYIEDGCSPRAALAAQYLESLGWRRPAKIFALGNLSLERDERTVFWWYHVALIVRVGSHAYVLDPSVELSGPLEVSAWSKRISTLDPSGVLLSVCNPFAYGPWSMCYVSGPEEEEGASYEARILRSR